MVKCCLKFSKEKVEFIKNEYSYTYIFNIKNKNKQI